MVEAALIASPPPSTEIPLRKRGRPFVAAPLAAGVLIALIVAFVLSGHWPEFHGLVKFSASAGIIAVPPSEIARVEIRTGRESIALRRDAGSWMVDGAVRSMAVAAEIASHLKLALRFLHVSEPMREIPASELTAASFAEFGLDPPASVVLLDTAAGTVATISFGMLNPAGTSQYVRVAGQALVYLMPRHVGTEWQVVGDMLRRLKAQTELATARPGASLLLPVSLAQVWAVEIVFAGKLTRFERDGSGAWFRHVGQHSHAGGANVHVADPAQARVIEAALDAFDQATIDSHVAHDVDVAQISRFGLALPSVIVMFYARDSSQPLARVEFGASADKLDRYARLAPDGDVVTVAGFEVTRLTDLLKAVGAGS